LSKERNVIEMRKGLIIIDIQNDYFEGGKMTVDNSEKASLNANKILNYFRENNMPIIHIQHISTREDATFFLKSTKGVEIHKNVEPKKNEKIIEKHFPNAFRETELLNYLKDKGITDLVICGMMTHMCIATTRAGKDLGFNIQLISDACATRDLEINGEIVNANEVQKSFLASLNYFYSEVLPADNFINKN